MAFQLPAATTALLWGVFAAPGQTLPSVEAIEREGIALRIPAALRRTSAFLTHPVFNTHHSETEMLRYIRSLSDKDLALDRSMIPLGSCTMKLNATSEMIPITWPGFANVHPFAPADQQRGYQLLDEQLRAWLCQATGYAGISLQPNAGSQGEYAGLLVIKAYHESRGEGHRHICLIPSSAHGTNPASAQMVGMSVVVVKCDARGNVDLDDLKAKCELHAANLAAAMITYPSTFGVYEQTVTEICGLVHDAGQVYSLNLFFRKLQFLGDGNGELRDAAAGAGSTSSSTPGSSTGAGTSTSPSSTPRPAPTTCWSRSARSASAVRTCTTGAPGTSAISS